MVTIILHCPHCGSEALVRDGHAPNGKQKYRCHGCGRRSRENPTPSACLSRTQQLAWPHAHVRGFSHHCVHVDQKKVAQLPPFHTTLIAPDPEDAASTTLELDELWSFVLKKAKEVWVWIALCRKTRQVVAYALGDRSKQTCLRLWEAIPSAYRNGHCFTDFWAAYSAVIAFRAAHSRGPARPEKPPMWSAGTTRLSQRLARFVRMTLSFSKSVVMHEACLLLFLHRYNRERAILLK